MRTFKPSWLLLVLVLAVALWNWLPRASNPANGTAPTNSSAMASAHSLPSYLPPEAHTTLQEITAGGPYPHRQDGVVFGNYEGLLPNEPRGYYHEYTVETPGAGDRGARRIITGGSPPQIYYYTDDHYHSFRSFQLDR